MHPMINIALKAARDAAEAIAHSSDRLDRIKVINDEPDSFVVVVVVAVHRARRRQRSA